MAGNMQNKTPTKKEVAAMFGVTYQTISRWCKRDGASFNDHQHKYIITPRLLETWKRKYKHKLIVNEKDSTKKKSL